MELSAFLEHVDQHLDPDCEETVLALTPQLEALGRNRRFVAQFLAGHLERPDFQRDNLYADTAMVIARRPSYTVRVVGWPSEPMPFYGSEDADDVAHTHTFQLLTYGYRGPGYRTEMYDCIPDELIASCVGDRVTVGAARRSTLSEGSVLFYPAFRVAHIQHPPSEYSVSLNLMVHPRNERGFEQYFVSPHRGVLTGIGGRVTEGAESILRLASRLPRDRTEATFRRIAGTHPLRRVRELASQIVSERTIPGITRER